MSFLPAISVVLFVAASVFILIAALAGLRLLFSKGSAQIAEKCKYLVKAFTFNSIVLFLLSWFLME